jgi:hypothetical protein
MSNASPNDTAKTGSSSDAMSAVGECPLKSLDVSIIPVRYAIDEVDIEGKPLNPLPKKEKWHGKLKLTESTYTLRQLRDGWVYVYDQNEKTFHEYQVVGSQLIKFDWGSDEANKPTSQRGSQGESKSYLSYPAGHTIYLSYSHHRWTWRVCEHMRSSGGSRSKWMRKLDLSQYCTTMDVAHAGFITSLDSSVADICAGAVPSSEMFSGTCTPLKAIEGGNEVPTFIETKAASKRSDYLSSLPDEKSALFVALDDVMADLTDVVLKLSTSYVDKEACLENEESLHKFRMAEIARSLGRVRIPNAQLPQDLVDDPIRELEFEEALNDYLQMDDQAKESFNNGSMIYMVAFRQSEAAKQKKSAIKNIYGFDITDKMEKEWRDVKIYQDEVEWDALKQFLIEHYTKLNGKDERIKSCYREAAYVVSQFKTESLAIGIDTQSSDDIAYLLDFTSQISVIFKLSGDDEAMAEQYNQIFSINSPKNLFALAPTGFSHQGWEALDKQMTGLKKQVFNTGSPDDVTAFSGILSNWEGLAGDGRVQDKAWFLALAKPIQDDFSALAGAVKGKAAQSWQAVMDLAFPTQLKGMNGTEALIMQLRGVLLEGMMNEQAVLAVNPNYAKSLSQFHRNLMTLVNERAHILNIKPGQSVSKNHVVKSVSRINNKIKRMFSQELPALVVIKNEALNARAQQVISQYVDASLDGAKQAGSAVKATIGGWGRVFVILGVWNVVAALNGIESRLKNAHTTADVLKAVLEPIYDAVYTVQFIFSISLGQAWDKIVGNSELLETTIKDILQTGTEEEAALLSRFASLIRIVAVVGFIASVLETVDSTLKAFDKLNTPEETVGYALKGLATGANAVVFAVQVVRLMKSIVGRAALTAVLAPWMLTLLTVASVVYLVALVIINLFHRSDLEKWLLQSTWGKKSAGWSEMEEIKQFEMLAYRPTVQLEKQTSERGASWLLSISFPAIFEGKEVGLSVTHNQQVGNHGQMRHYKALPVDEQRGKWTSLQQNDKKTPTYLLPIKGGLRDVEVTLEVPVYMSTQTNDRLYYQGSLASDGSVELDVINGTMCYRTIKVGG